MRFATTLLLAAAALALGLYAFLDFSGTLEKVFGDSPPPVLAAPVSQAVTSFSLRNQEENRTVELLDGQWQLTEPVSDRADPGWVDQALETFSSLRASEYLPDTSQDKRADYGLDPEQATTLVISLSDEKTLSYQIGHQGPVPSSTYVSPGEADAYRGAFVVAGDFAAVMDKPVSAVIDPHLARFAPEEVVDLSFHRDQVDISLQRETATGGRWRLQTPFQQQADEDRVASLLVALSTLTVTPISLDAPEASPPHTPDTRTIQLGFSGGRKPVILTFSPHPDNDDLIQARHSLRPLLYAFDRQRLSELFPADAETLRERRLLRVLAADISQLTVTPQGGTPLQLENPGTWLIQEGEGQRSVLANPDQGERFLSLLNDTIVTQYLEGGPEKEVLYGLDEPRFLVEMSGTNLGPQPTDQLVMRVGLPLGDSPQAFVAFSGSDLVAAVPKSFLTGLAHAADPIKWKRLEVLNVAFELIEEVTLEKPGEDPLTLKVDLLNPEDQERLQLTKNGQDHTADLNKHAAGQLILDLGNLNASSWLSSVKESAIALADPSLKITLKSRAGGGEDASEGRSWTLRFAPVNAEIPAFYYGQLEGTPRPEPFLIENTLYHRLSGENLLLEAP